MIKPYLKWAGGKRQLLQAIKRFLPSRIEKYVYYEPFVGAGAVLFELQPKKAIINDFNTQLILTYHVIKDNVEELIDRLRIHKKNNSKDYYYKIRSQDRDIKYFDNLNDTEKAARLIFMNKTCYNGLYRVNSQGLFNVPYGTYKNPTICEENVLRSIHNYLKSNEIEILNGDFTVATKNANTESFVYFDPPYHSPNNSNFTGYQADGFGESEQIRLRDNYLELTNKGVKCLLSNSATNFIKKIYSDKRFDIFTIQAKRLINSNSSKRGEVNEVLIKNWR
jgi:DNA adenine methylase